eukprot:3536900-Pyramimonas_sp.AAC.1
MEKEADSALAQPMHVEPSPCPILARPARKPGLSRALTRPGAPNAACHPESGQHWICRDVFKLTIDRQKPDQDLHYFYIEWMERYQELYGAREPSNEMKASMHAHVHEQVRQVPWLQSAMQ